MAHVRRKIHDVHVRSPTAVTTEALKRIGELYAIEAEIRGSPAVERLALRKERSIPLMQSLYDWIQQQMATLSRHSNTAKAFAYMLKLWESLNEYCRNGWVEIGRVEMWRGGFSSGISVTLYTILCKCLFSEVTVQAVTELDNKAAHRHTPVSQRHRPFL